MEKKNRQTHRKYDPQFRQEALKQVENGRSVPSVAQALGISEALLYGWRKKALAQPTNGTPVRSELEALRKQVKQLETARDILKKALALPSYRPVTAMTTWHVPWADRYSTRSPVLLRYLHPFSFHKHGLLPVSPTRPLNLLL